MGRSKSAQTSESVFFAPGDPLAHGGLGGQEAPGDLAGGQAPHQAERERCPGLRGQGGVAGQEDEAQDVVLDVVDLGVEVGHLLLLS